MKLIYIFLFLSGMILSGCISNPAKQVPVVQVNITFVEQQGIAQVVNYKLTQKTVNYLSRPKTTVAESFPAIAARTMIIKGKNSSIGPWETLPYKGNGIYSFNVGFNENDYPSTNDSVYVSFMVVDIKGERIGPPTSWLEDPLFVHNIVWK